MSTAPASTVRRLRRRGLGRQHAQIIADLDHRALDEQAVDARRLLQGLAQPAARVEVELQRDGAEMQIEIDERDPLTPLCGHQPGAGDRRGRRADPAAAADEDDHLPQPVGGRSGRAAVAFQYRGERFAGDGLTR